MANKIGRDKVKCKLYRDHKTREKNKIKRILQSSGVTEAKRWAHQYNVENLLDKLLEGAKRGRVHQNPAGQAG